MEEFFTRCEGWLTGIETLDAQHTELAACINKVAGASCGTENTQTGDCVARQEELSELVGNLYQTVKAHFEYEEAVMLKAEYPGFAAHRREHIMLLAELTLAVNMEDESAHIQVDSKMLRELKTWFIAHVSHSDCKFSAYISGHRMVSELNQNPVPVDEH